MKHLKTLLIFVLTFMVLSTNYAASVANASYVSIESKFTTSKNNLKKEKRNKKEKTSKKHVFKKLLNTGDGHGYNIAAFVLGLVGLSFCWFPYLGLALCIAAIVLGGMGLKKS
jgi:hypothetical protein